MKEIIDKVDFITIRNFCSMTENVKKIVRQATELGENIYKRHIW